MVTNEQALFPGEQKQYLYDNNDYSTNFYNGNYDVFSKGQTSF